MHNTMAYICIYLYFKTYFFYSSEYNTISFDLLFFLLNHIFLQQDVAHTILRWYKHNNVIHVYSLIIVSKTNTL